MVGCCGTIEAGRRLTQFQSTIRSMTLDESGLTLVSRALGWIDLACDSAEPRSDDVRGVQRVFADIHMLALSLRHLHECLRVLDKHLEPERGWPSAVRAAWTLYESVYRTEDCKHLRDALEHEAEYIAGVGRNPDLIEGPGRTKGHSFSWSVPVLRTGIRGREYSLQEPLDGAANLAVPLLHWYEVEAGQRWAGTFSIALRHRLSQAETCTTCE